MGILYTNRALRAALIAAAAAPIAGLAAAGQGERIWNFESDGSWLAEDASLGNRGTEVFTNLGSYVNRRGLLSAHDQDPPALVWSDEQVGINHSRRSASAGLSDLHVTLQAEYTASSGSLLAPIVRAYRGSSSQVLWEHEQALTVFALQYMDVFCSRDGDRIVTLVGASSGARMTVYAAGAASPLLSVQLATFGAPLGAALSADGTTLLVGNSMRAQVYDVATGALLHQHYASSGTFAGALDLSADGSRFVLAKTTGLEAYERTASGAYVAAGVRPLQAGEAPHRIACSDDGEVVAVASGFQGGTNVVGVRALEWSTGQELGGWRSTGSAGLQNQATALDVAPDGRVVVAGFAGDGAGAPEVCVLHPATGLPVTTHDLAGSVRAVELSADGGRFVVASLGGHLSGASSGGAVALYATRDSDLVVEGVPTQGSTVELVHTAAPGQRVIFLGSGGFAATPRVLGAAGLLHLDEGSLEIVPGLAFAGQDGVARKSLQLLGVASQLGTTRHYQAIGLSPRRLSESVATVTVLP